jgi:hypothetical protein
MDVVGRHGLVGLGGAHQSSHQGSPYCETRLGNLNFKKMEMNVKI